MASHLLLSIFTQDIINDIPAPAQWKGQCSENCS